VRQQLVQTQDLVDARLYENEEQVIRDALRHLLSDRPDLRVSVAVHRYRTDEELSLNQAAAIAGVSLERMKEILERHDVPLRLGPATIEEARVEYAALAAWPRLMETDVDVELEERYIFRDAQARRFLQAHPHLTGFLQEAVVSLQSVGAPK